jgi:hypothetical protein
VKHDIEQFKQLPQSLPPGERLIWQGKPSVRGLAWRAFHIRELPLYFGAFLAWRLWTLHEKGAPIAEYGWAAIATVGPALLSALALYGLAWLFARAATYTVTSKRVLLHFGVALPMTLNIPLGKIEGAALKTYRDGSGDIPLKLVGERVSHLLLWPHVRPWKLVVSEPMLRAVPNATGVADRLNEALTNYQVMAAANCIIATKDLPNAASVAA